MRGRNAGGAAQADPLGREVPLWNVLMSGTGHSRDDDRGMDGRDGLATGHSSPDHDLFAIRFSLFLLHRFASNAIIY